MRGLSLNTIESLNDIDWSFPSVGNSGLHSIHWYPATYVSAIPGTLIGHLTSHGDCVVDPFCGSGTSGVEAARLGRDYVGIDNNPIACLISSAKLYFPFRKRFLASLDQIERAANESLMSALVCSHPRYDELRLWYHPQTLQELLSVLNAILQVKEGHVQDCMLAVFSGVLKNSSSQGRHWGWVCDNVRPKPDEIVYRSALHTFMTTARQFLSSSESAFDELLANVPGATRMSVRSATSVINGDSVEMLGQISEESVKLVMTSPPYFGVADYVKSQRLSYLWFDVEQLAGRRLGFTHFEALRSKEAGARSNRGRGDSYHRYISYMGKFFEASRRVLRDDGYMALVVGESTSRPQTTEALLLSAKSHGFSLLMRRERDILAHRRRLMAKVACEEILVFGVRD